MKEADPLQPPRSREAYEALHRRSLDAPEAFWLDVASELHFFDAPTKARPEEGLGGTWFADGTTNLAHSCLDRHLANGRRNKAAIIWEGEPGDRRVLTYHLLHREVCRFANVLKRLGARRGDRVAIYMGMVPEAVIAMLACARIGAVHASIFPGLGVRAVAARIDHVGAKLVITQDGARRRGEVFPLWTRLGEALALCPSVKQTVVLQRAVLQQAGGEATLMAGRDHLWSDIIEAVDADCDAPSLAADHPAFILFTSGPEGLRGVVHSTAGYMVGAYLTTRLTFDPNDEDTYWCTADLSWSTGHSDVLYGPLLNGATVVLYEGAPNHPDPGRTWEIIERHGVTVFHTSTAAIRTARHAGDRFPMKHELASLRLLGTTGEPIDHDTWTWYRALIGAGRAPIVNAWAQTESGTALLATLPGVAEARPSSCGVPLPGVAADVVDGALLITEPWPAMAQGFYGERDGLARACLEGGAYRTGDAAHREDDGCIHVTGRVDHVVNVNGHRVAMVDVERALRGHASVTEAAVVGRPDELEGEALVAFVTLVEGAVPSSELRDALIEEVADAIGDLFRPAAIRFADALPSEREALAKIASREPAGPTTLEDLRALA